MTRYIQSLLLICLFLYSCASPTPAAIATSTLVPTHTPPSPTQTPLPTLTFTPAPTFTPTQFAAQKTELTVVVCVDIDGDKKCTNADVPVSEFPLQIIFQEGQSSKYTATGPKAESYGGIAKIEGITNKFGINPYAFPGSSYIIQTSHGLGCPSSQQISVIEKTVEDGELLIIKAVLAIPMCPPGTDPPN